MFTVPLCECRWGVPSLLLGGYYPNHQVLEPGDTAYVGAFLADLGGGA